MNIYDARNFQKQIIKEASSIGAFGRNVYCKNKFYYYVVVRILSEEKYQSFIDGNITINLESNLAETIIQDNKRGIHHKLFFYEGKLAALLVIDVD